MDITTIDIDLESQYFSFTELTAPVKCWSKNRSNEPKWLNILSA